jgi:putative YphP/YqiW family bacilliredoxin
MRYDPQLVQPMREELTRIGFEELRTPEAVDAFLARPGTKLLVVNSVCGCAAGQARPGVALALQHDTRPEHLGTVFAGQDADATARARSRIADYPPSSPSFAMFKDDEVVHFVPRHAIENSPAPAIAYDLVSAFDEHCKAPVR